MNTSSSAVSFTDLKSETQPERRDWGDWYELPLIDMLLQFHFKFSFLFMLWESEAAVGKSLVNHYIQLQLGWVIGGPLKRRSILLAWNLKLLTSDIQAVPGNVCACGFTCRPAHTHRAQSNSVWEQQYSSGYQLHAAAVLLLWGAVLQHVWMLLEARSCVRHPAHLVPFAQFIFRVYKCVGRYIFTIWGTVHNLTFHLAFGY